MIQEPIVLKSYAAVLDRELRSQGYILEDKHHMRGDKIVNLSNEFITAEAPGIHLTTTWESVGFQFPNALKILRTLGFIK